MGKIIVFANQKGGVGKTTTTANIGAFIAEAGKKVLLIDFDPQGNLSSSVGVERKGKGIYDLIMDNCPPEEVIKETAVENLFAIPSNINLTGATVELVEKNEREYYLKKALKKIENQFNYILIDCPPSLDLLTLNGLTAADYVMVPLQTEYFALEGLTQLLNTIKIVQKNLNKSLQLGGILFTMFDSRTRLANEVVTEVSSYFKEKVFKTVIPRNIKLSEAPSHAVPINLYDPQCLGGKSYKKLAQEVMDRVKA